MTDLAESTPAPHRTPSPVQARALIQGVINLVLVIMTVRDIRQRSADEIKGNRKLWLMAAFAPPFGPIAYLVFGRRPKPQTPDMPLEVAV